jgi:ubiquinone/menaquinone biosynthesis C-methylase UbiE
MTSRFTGWIDRILAKPIRYLLESPARLLKDYVKDGMTVLDVGCGAGYYSLGMAELVGPKGRVIAVDTETDAVMSLKKKAEKAGLTDRIEARVCSEHDLGILDLNSQVDFALAVYVVHHARDTSSLMGDVHRALRPGARLLVVEPRHHASAAERESTEAAAQGAGFTLAGHPRLRRDWAVSFVKE